MKIKICDICKRECYYWSAKLKACKDCAMRLKAKEPNLSPSKPRTAISKYKTGEIKKVSDTQFIRLKKYRVARGEYLKQQPVCEYPNCGSTDITLHHMRGKIGELLWNNRWFKSLCLYHHRIVEESPLEAKIMELSANRLDKE